MTYALVTDNTIRSIGPLPKVAQRLDDGTWRKLADTTEQQRCGYFEVVDTPRPDDTTTTTHDYSVELVDGTPTVVWTPRPKTADEQAAEVHQTNRRTVEDRLRADLTTVDTITGTPSANVTGTTVAEVRSSSQTAIRDLQRQVKDLARMNKRLIRQALQAFDSAD